MTGLVGSDMPSNAINGSLEVLATLPQLQWMYAQPKAHSESACPTEPFANAIVCRDLHDNLIDGTLELLASLSQLRGRSLRPYQHAPSGHPQAADSARRPDSEESRPRP